jgi:hypothetical protein
MSETAAAIESHLGMFILGAQDARTARRAIVDQLQSVRMESRCARRLLERVVETTTKAEAMRTGEAIQSCRAVFEIIGRLPVRYRPSPAKLRFIYVHATSFGMGYHAVTH